MDPSTALLRLRQLSAEIDLCPESEHHLMACLAEEMAATWDGLDDWISKGGFLPGDWG